MQIHCSSEKPANGFYRYGEQPDFPSRWPASPVILAKGGCNKAINTVTLVGAAKFSGFLVSLSFAGSLADIKAADLTTLVDSFATLLDVPLSSVTLLRASAGSFIVDM